MVGAVLAGCQGAPRGPDAAREEPLLLALEGRWPVPMEPARALLKAAQWPDAAGEALFGGAIVQKGALAASLDYASFDAGASRALDASGALDAPAAGEIALEASWARAQGLAVGDVVEARATAFPKPLVAAAYEMERLRPCAQMPDARLCFDGQPAGHTALRLRVGLDATDLAFIPEAAELGPGGLPAWWNGTIVAPNGTSFDFRASMDARGGVVAAEWPHDVPPGDWRIRFRLESNRVELNGGAAGIVRVREPGYGWFDDRLAIADDPVAQSHALLAWGNETRATLRVARLVERPIPGAHALVAPEDARALLRAGPAEACGLVVVAKRAPAAVAALSEARNRSQDAVSPFLRARPVPPAPAAPRTEGSALLFRAPLGLDVATLPDVPGGASPFLAVLLETPLGETPTLDKKEVPGLRVLAFAGPGTPPWRMPAEGRWTDAKAALENITRSRTLVLSGDDWAPGGLLTSRLVLGDERVGRVAVVVEGVGGGPARTGWASASLVAGSGRPIGPAVVLPLAPGADAAAVQAAAREAWGPLGVAPT